MCQTTSTTPPPGREEACRSARATAPETLAERIAAVFGRSLRLFVIFSGVGETWLEVLGHTGAGTRDRFREGVSHGEVERLVGEAVVLPLRRSARPASLGGSRHPLLALIPSSRSRFDAMDVVAVADYLGLTIHLGAPSATRRSSVIPGQPRLTQASGPARGAAPAASAPRPARPFRVSARHGPC